MWVPLRLCWSDASVRPGRCLSSSSMCDFLGSEFFPNPDTHIYFPASPLPLLADGGYFLVSFYWTDNLAAYGTATLSPLYPPVPGTPCPLPRAPGTETPTKQQF